MSFWTEGELNFDAQKSMDMGGILLPGGQLLISGEKTSFRPKGGSNTYGYETDGKGNIVKHYVNGQQVPLEIWGVEMIKEEGLRDSDFGRKPFHGMKSLLVRGASRFLWEGKPSTLPVPAEDSQKSEPAAQNKKKSKRCQAV
ncbi:MAG: hypothetical protein LBS22_02440 [Puniceicoccales bacterium]|jgi:hypothetical protein|nr:hypothetical protein [Puniceicoccales bacterium]